MIRFRYLCLILVVATLAGCNKTKTVFWQGKVFDAPAEIAYRNVALDRIVLDTVNCSYEGLSGILENGNIYYIDKYFSYLYEFSPEGRLIERRLGVGRGPKETIIQHIDINAFSKNGELALLGSNVNFDVFDNTYQAQARFVVPYDPTTTDRERFEMYSYARDNFSCRMYEDIIYIGMISYVRSSFNYFSHGTDFLQNSFHIGRVDWKKKITMPMMLKGHPDMYFNDSDKYYEFRCVNFDIDRDGNFYVNFEADSMIYKYTLDQRPLVAFGHAGRNMDMNYMPIASLEQVNRDLGKNRLKKGYYGTVEYIDATGYLFRSYLKGADAATDGLQIYKDGVLVGDVDVPKGFRVTGYNAPYYYSQVFEDEEAEKLTVYRFRL